MTAQLDLFSQGRIRCKGRHLARKMIAALSVRVGPMTRREFDAMGLTDRECRIGRKASHGRIICGQFGFVLMRNATPEQIHEAREFFASMAKQNLDEVRQIDIRSHGMLSGKVAVNE